jgi:hypothetical protein
MKFHYDLHVHSVLSPCADVLMTPNNILNMASLKGLDILAVTDHNSLKQQSVIAEIARSFAFLLLFGVEIHVREGYHILVYLKTLTDAIRLDRELEIRLDRTAIPAPHEGKARLTDVEDFVIGELSYPTARPLSLSLSELFRILDSFDHLRFFAHVDRPVPGEPIPVGKVPMNGIELSAQADDSFLVRNGWESFPVLRNSDAHQLMDINEISAHNVLDLPRLDAETLFGAFRR